MSCTKKINIYNVKVHNPQKEVSQKMQIVFIIMFLSFFADTALSSLNDETTTSEDLSTDSSLRKKRTSLTPTDSSLSSENSHQEEKIDVIKQKIETAKQEYNIEELLTLGEELASFVPHEQQRAVARDVLFPLEAFQSVYYPSAGENLFRNLNTAALIVAYADCDLSPMTYHYLYKIYSILGNQKEADFNDVVETLKIKSEDFELYKDDPYRLGNIQVKFNPTELKEEEKERIVSSSVPPESASTYALYVAGLILSDDGKYDKAKLFYEKSGEKGCLEAYVKLAEMLADEKIPGDQKDLMAYIKKADRPYAAIGSIALAKAYRTQIPEIAIKLFERAGKLNDFRGYQELLTYNLVTGTREVAGIEAKMDKLNEKRNLILQKIKKFLKQH